MNNIIAPPLFLSGTSHFHCILSDSKWYSLCIRSSYRHCTP